MKGNPFSRAGVDGGSHSYLVFLVKCQVSEVLTFRFSVSNATLCCHSSNDFSDAYNSCV